MLRLRFTTLVITLSVAALVCRAADSSSVRVPVLLELFTSEGCSSCPPADRLLEALDQKQPVAGADLIVLSEHVDYWDRLGWKDPFSSAQYTARQQAYSNQYKLAETYTPQLVVDGRYGFVGSDRRQVSSAIQKAIRERKVPVAISNVIRDGSRITAHIEVPSVDQGFRERRAILYVALAENREESHVRTGENAGSSLSHVAVTRVLKKVGMIDLDSASGQDVNLVVQSGWGVNGWRIVAFVQDPKSGHVLGVSAQKL